MSGVLVTTQSVDREKVVAQLKQCYDPEIPVNIWDLGLVYKVEEKAPGEVVVEMTLTALGCPMAGPIQEGVKMAMEEVPGVKSAQVNIVYDPPWDPNKATEDGKLQLRALGLPV